MNRKQDLQDQIGQREYDLQEAQHQLATVEEHVQSIRMDINTLQVELAEVDTISVTLSKEMHGTIRQLAPPNGRFHFVVNGRVLKKYSAASPEEVMSLLADADWLPICGKGPLYE